MEHATVVFWWAFGGCLGLAAAFVALLVVFFGLLVVAHLIMQAVGDSPKGKK